MENENMSLSVIENVSLSAVQGTVQKIKSFQSMIKSEFTQNHDYGIIPGTKKPTLLKPGAEKILMLLGLTSEFEIIDSTRDFEKGFFQYQVKCTLKNAGMIITEKFRSANTKETKYIKSDAFTLDNVVLKMAKKRALVDGALLVGSLSDIFTQDIEDMDLKGEKVSTQQKTHTDNSGTITQAQAKRMYALANGDKSIIEDVLKGHNYKNSAEVKKVDYKGICESIEALANAKKEG